MLMYYNSLIAVTFKQEKRPQPDIVQCFNNSSVQGITVQIFA